MKNIFDNDDVTRLAASHHNPDKWDEWIVAEADRISSGADRQDSENELGTNYLTTPLSSIFNNINLNNNENNFQMAYHLKPLKPDYIFPKQNTNFLQNDYSIYWNNQNGNLLNDLNNKKDRLVNENLFLALDTLLEQYLWCIPSATQQGGNDISLYDHSVTTAAIASVLYEYHNQKNSLNDISSIKNGEEKKFLFVTGDVSGIQNYIFDLETTTAMLRARSFEIQALCEVVAFEILERLNLPIFCRISNGRGRFLLMLPNTESSKNELEKLRKELDSYMLKRYYGELALCISDGIEASANDMMQSDVKKLFSKFSQDSSIAKLKKFQKALENTESHILSEDYEKIRGAENICNICMIRASQII